MASMKKCKNCATKNSKISKTCSNCGQELYTNVSYSIAIKATIISDIIMTFVYIYAIILFVDITNNITMDNIYYVENLPIANSMLYYILILFFIISALVKILFILNHFILKSRTLVSIRRAFMFVDAFYMFPMQSILALYFYNPATAATATKTEEQGTS